MFWLCFAFSLILPCGMLVFGIRWLRRPPAQASVFCYRTESSARSEETWRFAHHYIGKLWLRCSLVLLPVTVVVMLFFRNSFMTYLPWVMAAQGALFAFSILPPEGALQRRYPREEAILPQAEEE